MARLSYRRLDKRRMKEDGDLRYRLSTAGLGWTEDFLASQELDGRNRRNFAAIKRQETTRIDLIHNFSGSFTALACQLNAGPVSWSSNLQISACSTLAYTGWTIRLSRYVKPWCYLICLFRV